MINNGQESLQFTMEDTNSSVFECGQTSCTKTKKKVGAKVVKPRGPASTQFEDVLLCGSWCNTRMDPTCEIEQKDEKYWENVHKL